MRDDVITWLDRTVSMCSHHQTNRIIIMYTIHQRTSTEDDLGQGKANRVIVYCRSLNMCSMLYVYVLKDKSYNYGSDDLSVNRLFGMFHSNTADHNKQTVLSNMANIDGTIQVVFATTALYMGVNFAGLNTTIHYGAPRSMDDYLEELEEADSWQRPPRKNLSKSRCQ